MDLEQSLSPPNLKTLPLLSRREPTHLNLLNEAWPQLVHLHGNTGARAVLAVLLALTRSRAHGLPHIHRLERIALVQLAQGHPQRNLNQHTKRRGRSSRELTFRAFHVSGAQGDQGKKVSDSTLYALLMLDVSLGARAWMPNPTLPGSLSMTKEGNHSTGQDVNDAACTERRNQTWASIYCSQQVQAGDQPINTAVIHSTCCIPIGHVWHHPYNAVFFTPA